MCWQLNDLEFPHFHNVIACVTFMPCSLCLKQMISNFSTYSPSYKSFNSVVIFASTPIKYTLQTGYTFVDSEYLYISVWPLPWDLKAATVSFDNRLKAVFSLDNGDNHRQLGQIAKACKPYTLSVRTWKSPYHLVVSSKSSGGKTRRTGQPPSVN